VVALTSAGTLAIKSTAALSVNSDGSLSLAGSLASLKSDGPLVLKGRPIDLNGAIPAIPGLPTSGIQDVQLPDTIFKTNIGWEVEQGKITTIVANAAVLQLKPWREITVADWDFMQAVNVRATWLMINAAYDDLKKHQGNIITVTSVMTETGQPGQIHYSASKAAIIGLTRSLAREIGADGVRINSVMPGAIRTEHEVSLAADPKPVDDLILPLQSLKRRGYPTDLAGAFVFLASEDAAFITGQVINVDGGWVMY
jgi:3-oxoacyl-[acyl-carrier protein] reductase